MAYTKFALARCSGRGDGPDKISEKLARNLPRQAAPQALFYFAVGTQVMKLARNHQNVPQTARRGLVLFCGYAR